MSSSSLVERVFGMPAGAFLDAHWPDRPAHATGPVERFAELAVAEPADAARRWLARLIAELELGFAAHATAWHAWQRDRGDHASTIVDDREEIVVALHGRQRWRFASRVFELGPGAALFVPRGGSREIEVVEAPARALSFTFRIPAWTEMLANTLLHELAGEPAWRTPAHGGDPLPEPLARATRDAIETLRGAPPPRRR